MAVWHDTPIGARFERLVVISSPFCKENKQWYVECRCDCGERRTVLCKNIRGGHTKSCGCYKKDFHPVGPVTHGKSGTPTWRTYHGMLSRCYNKSIPNYKRYGARGIKVCQRWLDGFEFFYEDMGERPDGMTLDREDPNGDYTPQNCRWASNYTQANNKCDTIYIEYNGHKKTISDWMAITGFDRGAIETRLKLGWTAEDILTIPPERGRNQYDGGELISFNGKTQTFVQWANEIGISYETLKGRFYRGWSVEKALSSPLDTSRKKK